MKTLFTAVPVGIWAVISTCAFMGCAASSDDPSARAGESSGESSGQVSEPLAEAPDSVVGAYESTTPTTGYPDLRAIVFTRHRAGNGLEFFADVDTGIRCVTTPCPSMARIEGWYTATDRVVTLHTTRVVVVPRTDVFDEGRFDGTYDYRREPNGAFAVTREGETRHFQSVDTYCRADKDCDHQSYIRPYCLGHAICGDDSRCGWQCGNP
ncbi:hypothetical protein [Pendulispora albinea]|uniref:Lipoprotein n=1 Tax=Pendulispora albinea TaxID=2741071 RepID=A0ABZ2M4A1_9BACT